MSSNPVPDKARAYRLDPRRQIFCNRNLRMESVGAIGFDLDHTLAHYNGPRVERLAFDLTKQRLVERFGYPRELLKVAYERDFVIRGLVVDKKRGHVLKMDYHNYVTRAYHGTRPLLAAERKAVYRTGRVRMGTDSYISVDTLFHLPEVYLFAVLVDLLQGKKASPRKVYVDVREAIDSVHGDGSLKREILGNMRRYIKRAPHLPKLLTMFQDVGKKLFLLTNSEAYYSDALLTYLLEHGRRKKPWTDYFDVICVDAGKPKFFTDLGRPLQRRTAHDLFDLGPSVMRGGNARTLERRLGQKGDSVLYFGDHTYGDILRSKKSLGWRTAMVVEELAGELEITQENQIKLDQLEHLIAERDILEGKIAFAKKTKEVSPAAQRKLDRLGREVDKLGDAINRTYNKYWGPLFKEGSESSRFGHQVKDFACIYMTQVSNFLNYSPNHYFRSPTDRLPHEGA